MSDMQLKSESEQAKLGLFQQIKARLVGRSRGFARDENGTIIIFGLTIFLLMLVATGMAIDFMRHENMRARLQTAMDRGLLAAADLDQENDPEAVMRDYVAKFAQTNGQYEMEVIVDEGLNYRAVSASATSAVDSMFLNMVGIESLDATVSGAAEQKVNKVEVSLVLDISGSMDDNDKLENMQTAANEFVDALITPDTRDLISITVVPYTGQVNAGEDLYSLLNVNQRHSYSYCLEFTADDFNEVPLNFAKNYEQTQHFEYSGRYYGYNDNYKIQNPWCSNKSQETIKYFLNDGVALKETINSYEPRTATGIHYAMKWGAALLDPSLRGFVSSMISQGKIPGEFEGRPTDYNDPETAKVIVLMTDGMNVNQYRIKSWAYNSASEYTHWARYTLWYYLNNYVYWQNHNDYYFRTMTANTADQYLRDICNTTNSAGILIFSIGFEISDNPSASQVMRDCATSDSHFYAVEGVEISEAFNSIAGTINQLRLTR
ncbi:Flp pilus assembly protein TadG [Litoreibacter ponti]|uniref:Flp pilus assembly protein TadG n=1 Tax=Litoreibacter ponti TaxID=1510457 RepID=A0A2T6BKW0_9RHOB|nr:TadE/TadG family type IV pilus assembly protein [Litoreibacter ponti]PTX56704.1 Flp pilus assembly protein TadG [Litoreibacter ponti]